MSIHAIQMSHTPATAASGGAQGPAAAELPESLSAEGLLMYCQTMIGNIEDDINAMMEEQMANLQRKKALSTVENAMKQCRPPKSKEDVDTVKKAIDDAISSLPPNDPTRKELEAFRENTVPKMYKPYISFEFDAAGKVYTVRSPFQKPIDTVTWDGYMTEIKNMKDDVAGNAELGMLRLQSKVSSYQTCFQMTSNTMSKMNQTEKSIIANVNR